MLLFLGNIYIFVLYYISATGYATAKGDQQVSYIGKLLPFEFTHCKKGEKPFSKLYFDFDTLISVWDFIRKF